MSNKTEYKEAIKRSNGTNTDISKILGNTPEAVCQYRQKNPDIDKLIKAKRMELIDKAENVLGNHLKHNDPKIRQDAAKYVTSRLGKNQGWSERTEVEHSGEMKNIQINLIEKSVEEIKDGKSNDKSQTEGNS